MRKMLKIVAMLLVIAAVVFAAGCAQKSEPAGNETPEAENQTSTEVEATTPVATPTETTEIAATPAVTPEVTNNTTGNITENATVQNVTHMSNTQRKMALMKNRTSSSDTVNATVNVSQNDSE